MQKETNSNIGVVKCQDRKKILEGLPEAEKIRFQLKVEGYSLVGNVDKYNTHILQAMTEYMNSHNVLYKVEKAFDISDNPLDSHKALWINIISFNSSKIVKRNLFFKKRVDTAQEAFYLMKDKLGLIPVLKRDRFKTKRSS